MSKTIRVELDARTRAGYCWIACSGDKYHSRTSAMECLGHADMGRAAEEGNPGANPLLPFGHLPAGIYSAAVCERPRVPERSYGPHPVIVLTPTGGDALIAQSNGRWGLMIHGGDFGENKELRRTHGCLRLSNSDMEFLVEQMWSAGIKRVEVVIKEEVCPTCKRPVAA